MTDSSKSYDGSIISSAGSADVAALKELMSAELRAISSQIEGVGIKHSGDIQAVKLILSNMQDQMKEAERRREEEARRGHERFEKLEEKTAAHEQSISRIWGALSFGAFLVFAVTPVVAIIVNMLME